MLKSYRNLIALVYTLIVDEHPLLATLIISSPAIGDDNEVVSSSVSNVTRLPKVVSEEIFERYKNTSDIPTKKRNPMIDVIAEFTTEVISVTWDIKLDHEKLDQVDHIEESVTDNVFVLIPSNINLLYYQLIRTRAKYLYQ